MPRYRITSGTFRDSDDSTKCAGQTIELGEDIARLHAAQLQPVPVPAEAKADAQAAQDPLQA